MKLVTGETKARVIRKRWGNYALFLLNKKCTVKILTVMPGKSLSMQRHRYRDELWFGMAGQGLVALDDHEFMMYPGRIIEIPRMHWHRLWVRAPKRKVCQVLEVSIGHFDEKDILRAVLHKGNQDGK